MSESLTRRQIDTFKAMLSDRYMALRQEISAELLRADQERYADLAGQVHDTGEAALADLLVDIGLAAIDRHVIEIRDIDAALIRIAEGRYGACCDCGDSIPLERLEAYPAARRCIVCQELHERTHAHGATPSL